jgi:hypothetical protein
VKACDFARVFFYLLLWRNIVIALCIKRLEATKHRPTYVLRIGYGRPVFKPETEKRRKLERLPCKIGLINY